MPVIMVLPLNPFTGGKPRKTLCAEAANNLVALPGTRFASKIKNVLRFIIHEMTSGTAPNPPKATPMLFFVNPPSLTIEYRSDRMKKSLPAIDLPKKGRDLIGKVLIP
jgi:hypothetical protein